MGTKINLETFRCSRMEHGEQCPSDFTRTNAFAPTLATLEQHALFGVVIMDTIAKYAICPFHAQLLRGVRKDVVPLNEVVSELSLRMQKARQEVAERRRVREEKEQRYERGNVTLLGEVLKAAIQR